MTQALLQQATQSVTTKGVFNLVLSDSPALDDLYARLMYDPDLRAMPWGETHLWFFRDVEESVVTHSGVPEENVHTGEVDEQMDCCVLAFGDTADIPEELGRGCTSFLIFASDTTPTDWTHSGVAHWFC